MAGSFSMDGNDHYLRVTTPGAMPRLTEAQEVKEASLAAAYETRTSNLLLEASLLDPADPARAELITTARKRRGI